MPGQFAGKVVLVTGGGAGIGRATAQAFAKEGARVAVIDVGEQPGQDTVRDIQSLGGTAIFIKADVSQPREVEASVNQIVQTFGGLDYAINNAGVVGDIAPTVDYSLDAWNRVIAINLTGVWLCLKYEIPRLLAQGGGAIVNTASILGLVGSPNTSAYTATKHGVVGLTQTAALEYSSRGIRVNAIAPGYIRTAMVLEQGVQAGHRPEVMQRLISLHPIGRLGTPEEVAQANLWLCSESASFITGITLPIDGGYTAQ